MTPEDYVLHFKIDGVDDCVIGIVPDTLDQGWTLGQVFLRSFYTLFDRDNNRIGFVRSNQDTGHLHQANTPQEHKDKHPNSVNNVVNANEGNKAYLSKRFVQLSSGGQGFGSKTITYHSRR